MFCRLKDDFQMASKQSESNQHLVCKTNYAPSDPTLPTAPAPPPSYAEAMKMHVQNDCTYPSAPDEQLLRNQPVVTPPTVVHQKNVIQCPQESTINHLNTLETLNCCVECIMFCVECFGILGKCNSDD